MSRIIILKNGSYLSVFILLFYFLVLPIPAYTATFNVTNEEELREALSIAESNGEDDVVNIASGTYSTLGETFTFESSEDYSLTIVGNGAGKTILDGGGMDRVLEINSVSDAAVLISLSGLTIQNGFHASIPEDPSKSDGGGIYVTSQNLTIENCEFLSNSESRAGHGGGLFANVKTAINLSGNLFAQNSAAFSGGGAYVTTEELTMSDNEFIGNSSGIDGGGAYVVADELSMSDNIFTENSTLSESDLGGGGVGITNTNDRSTATLTNNIFNSNHSAGNGGGLGYKSRNGYSDNVITLTNNTYTLNTADVNGGGLSINALQPPVILPPGVMEGPPSVIIMLLDIYNDIVFNNSAGDSGEDIFIFEEGYNVRDLTLNLFNNDFSDVFSNQLLTVGNNINEDPLFANAGAGNFSLQPDSPCIDAGDPDAPDLPETDIYGNPRGPIPDMGAVEYIEIVDGHGGNGGCSLTPAGTNKSFPLYLFILAVIVMRRILKRRRG